MPLFSPSQAVALPAEPPLLEPPTAVTLPPLLGAPPVIAVEPPAAEPVPPVGTSPGAPPDEPPVEEPAPPPVSLGAAPVPVAALTEDAPSFEQAGRHGRTNVEMRMTRPLVSGVKRLRVIGGTPCHAAIRRSPTPCNARAREIDHGAGRFRAPARLRPAA